MALMIKYQIFIDKHLPVQTQWKVNISKKYAICSNLLTKLLQQFHDVIIAFLLPLFDILVCT